jgi:hypothetical protein
MSTVILDTNLLILLVVGATSPKYIAKHKRLKAYSKDDYALLLGIMTSASKVIVTPNILTETSNLLAHINEPARSEIFRCFRSLIQSQATEEHYFESNVISARAEFIRLGLADVSLLEPIQTNVRSLQTILECTWLHEAGDMRR